MKATMGKAKGVEPLLQRCGRHKLFTALVLAEGVFLLFLTAGLFQKPLSIRLTAQDFATALAEAGTDEYQTQIEGETLSVTVPEDIKKIAVEDDTNETALSPLRSSGYAMRSGAYEVTIQYHADSTSPSTEAAYVKISEQRFTNLVYGEKIVLDGTGDTASGRIWVQLGAHAEDTVVQLTPRGECDFQIDEIVLQERPIYRFVRLLAFLFLFGVVDFLAWGLLAAGSGNPKKALRVHPEIAALTLICILACLPMFSNGLLWGDDIDFHLTRIAHLAQGLREHQFPVRMYTGMLNGYGYAAPLYYCDLFLYIPAVLYNCMLPLQTCYKIYGVMVTVGTAALCYVSLQHIFAHKDIATVGTALYLLASYRLVNVYLRSAVGEYTATAWLPLVVWGMYEICRQKKPAWRHWLPLAVGMAGIIQCHVITFEITCVFLLLFCLWNGKTVCRAPRLTALCKAAGVCIALCAWFLVPMLLSMATQEIRGAKVLPADFQSSGVSVYELLALFPVQKYSTTLAALGASLTLGAVAAFFVLWNTKRKKQEDPAARILLQYCLGFGTLAALFTLNKFPWNSLLSWVEGTLVHKLLALPQFPWRYLTIATILLVVAVTAALYILRQEQPQCCRMLCQVLLAAAVCCTGLFCYNLFQARTEIVKYDPIARDENTIGMGEYLLPGEADLNYPRPQADKDALQIKWYDKTDGVAHITLENTGDAQATVTLPIFDYGNYHAVDTEGVEWPMTMSEDSLLQITVPGGYSGAISIEYKEPPLWRAAEFVSLATCGGLLLLWLCDKKKRKLQQLPGDAQG